MWVVCLNLCVCLRTTINNNNNNNNNNNTFISCLLFCYFVIIIIIIIIILIIIIDALVILHNSLSVPKLLYTLRTAECSGRPALLQFDIILRDGLLAILNIHLTDDQWIQASLPVRNGGLVIRSATMLAPSTFLASATGTSDLQNKILRSGSVASPDPSFQTSFEVWTASSATLAPTGQEATEQRNWDSGIIMAALMSLTSKATDATRARFLAAQSAHAGDWLHAPPITAVGLRLSK